MAGGHREPCQVLVRQDRTRGHAGGQNGGCGRRLPAERRPPGAAGLCSASHAGRGPARARASSCRGEPARGHPAVAAAVAERREHPAARAALMEGAGLAAVRPRGAGCQLAAKATPSGSRVWAGASRGCSVGEPGPLRAAARMHKAPEWVLASGGEGGRGLATVDANGGGLGAVPVRLGTRRATTEPTGVPAEAFLAVGPLCLGPSVGPAAARGELEADGGEEPLAAKPRLHQSLRGWSGGSSWGGSGAARFCRCEGPRNRRRCPLPCVAWPPGSRPFVREARVGETSFSLRGSAGAGRSFKADRARGDLCLIFHPLPRCG